MTCTPFPESATFVCTLTLFYDQWRFDDSGISDEAGLQLYRHNGQRWELVGGIADTEKNSVIATGVTQLSTKWTFSNPNDGPLKVEENAGQNPREFVLLQNYPNPFNAITVISYSIHKSDFVTLKIYNLLGKEIRTVVGEFQEANTYSINFDASNLSSGVYLCRLQVGDVSVNSKKMLLLR